MIYRVHIKNVFLKLRKARQHIHHGRGYFGAITGEGVDRLGSDVELWSVAGAINSAGGCREGVVVDSGTIEETGVLYVLYGRDDEVHECWGICFDAVRGGSDGAACWYT